MKKWVKLNKPPSHQSLHLSSKEKSLISSKESISGKEVTSVKTSELDESLCGDPLMYATFVAPVHQYSTETEPSRQASFNYPSRQPSFKQNSSEAEGISSVAVGTSGEQQQQGNYSQFPGGLPVPGSRGKSKTPDKSYIDDVQDIYEEVPVEQWPLPPLPLGHEELDEENEFNQDYFAKLKITTIFHAF